MKIPFLRSPWAVAAAVVFGAIGAGCSNTKPEMPAVEKPAGLEAQPERLAFLCVKPGCDEAQIVNIHVNGTRRAAIKRILLRGDAAEDFSFSSTETAPFIVGANAGFDVEVRYTPKGAPRPGLVELLVTYTDASPEESEDRLVAGELSIPLVRRIVGEPILMAAPSTLSFGVVAVGETKTMPVTLSNIGFGNVAVEIDSAETTTEVITALLGDNVSLVPDATAQLPVSFAPLMEGYVSTKLTVRPTSKDLQPAVVLVEGTSLSVPRLALEPGGDIDFGELEKGKTRVLAGKLVNIGGANLTLSSLTVADLSGNLSATLPDLSAPIVVAPLERVPFELFVGGTVAGEVNATVTITSDDPQAPSYLLRVIGTVTQPELTLSPSSVDFGTVPVGWVKNAPVELKNTGYGKLTVKNISLVSGSSNLFTLSSLPALPLPLDREERIAVDVEFRAETMASFKGWLSVETDDPVNPFKEVPLSALAGSCEAGCPITNGTPSCASGKCEVGMCNAGFFDTDQDASSGCECAEVGVDPGHFCADSVYVGTLTDNDKDQTSRTGLIPLTDDEDLYRFFAVDAFTWLGENYKVKVRLDSTDPTIKLCVYRHDTPSHDNDCYFSNESCPANRTYQHGGSAGAGDDADFIVKVYRDANVGPTCTAYTLFMSNGL